MFKILDSFLDGKSCLGIDIGTTSIKAVEISGGKKKPYFENYAILESYGHFERLNSAIQTSSLKITDQLTVDLLGKLLGKAKFKSKEVAASLPSFSVFTTLLEIPQMPKADAEAAIKFQIPQYIPLPISEVTIDWLKVGEREDEKGTVKEQIFMISTPNEQIEKYRTIFKAAGLDLKVLEIEGLSLARSLIGTGENAPTLIADIGSRSTNILVVEGGFLKYGAQSDFAGASLTQAIASGLGINIRRAEDLKKQRGIAASGGEYELSTLTLPFLDAIISEIRRARNHYEKNYQAKIEKIILTGGGANLFGIEKYFREQFGFEVVVGDAFSKLNYPPMLEPMVKELGATLATAIGLGIRSFV